MDSDEMVKLSVRGVTVEVSLQTLLKVPDSSLEAMFSGRHLLPQKNGKIEIDRDPVLFRHVIQFLRNDLKCPFLYEYQQKAFEEELEFWGLPHPRNLVLESLQ